MAELVNRILFTEMVERALKSGDLAAMQERIASKENAVDMNCQGTLPDSIVSHFSNLKVLFKEQFEVIVHLRASTDAAAAWSDHARFYSQKDGTVMCRCGNNAVMVGDDFAPQLKLPCTPLTHQSYKVQFEAMMTGKMYWARQPLVTELINRVQFTQLIQRALDGKTDLATVQETVAAKQSATLMNCRGTLPEATRRQLKNLQALYKEQLDVVAALRVAADAAATWKDKKRFYLRRDGTVTCNRSREESLVDDDFPICVELGGSRSTCKPRKLKYEAHTSRLHKAKTGNIDALNIHMDALSEITDTRFGKVRSKAFVFLKMLLEPIDKTAGAAQQERSHEEGMEMMTAHPLDMLWRM